MKKDMTEQGRGLLQNDRTLLGGLFGFYLICICAVLGLMGWWFARREMASRANATATGAVIATEQAAAATQQAHATFTAIANTTEQSQYEFIERFDAVSARWYVGIGNELYGDTTYAIKDGVYEWDIRSSMGFPFWVNYYKKGDVLDFDAYIDTRLVKSSTPGSACAGLIFRKAPNDWDHGAYVYIVCSDARFTVQSFNGERWIFATSTYNTELIRQDDWNRIGISARGDHFRFTINNVEVFEMTDDQYPQGSLALYAEVTKGESVVVSFDNFGIQSR